MSRREVCSVDGCPKPVRARGWCRDHYYRWKRNGDPVGGRTPPGEPLAFFQRAMATETDECIIWPYALTGRGYASLKDGEYGRAPLSHHICIATHGPRPSRNHEAAHLCGKMACINRRHIRWLTRSANQLEREIHGTSNRGARNGSAKLTEAQVLLIKQALASGETQKSIAAQFGVSRAAVGRIASGKAWRTREELDAYLSDPANMMAAG